MLARAPRSGKFRNMATWIVMGVVAASMLSAAWTCYDQQTISLQDISLAWALLAVIMYGLFSVANAWGWSLILAAMAHPMHAQEAISLWIRCESLRWLPGSVWNFGARAVETTRRGTPKLTCAASMVLDLLFAVSSRLLIVVVVYLSSRQALHVWVARIPFGQIATVACAVLLMTGIGVMATRRAFHTRQQTSFQDVLLAIRGADRIWMKLVAVQCYYLMTSVWQGLGFVCVVRCIHPDGGASPAALIALSSAAWLVGFFAIFAPGGLVVREAFLATALAGWLPPAESIAIAVGWRALQIMVETVLLVAVLTTVRPRPYGLIRPLRRKASQ